MSTGPHVEIDDGHLPQGVVVDDRYEVIRPLGHGGMGSVYLARDREFNRQVALKMLAPKYVGRPEREKRFDNEARYGGRLPHHPNIAMTIDAGRMANGRPYIVMEYVEGPAINVLSIFEEKKLELPRLLALMRGVAEAMSAMHRVGVVHRDLTPANILVSTFEGRSIAKVIDFSHAAADVPRLRIGDPRRLTGAHETPGTPGYMPPEQVRSDPPDARMDVFSFGVVFWELLSGKHAFRHLERDEYFELQVANPTAPPPIAESRPDLSEFLCSLIDDCTHVHIAARPSASAVILRLDEIIREMHDGQLHLCAPASPAADASNSEVAQDVHRLDGVRWMPADERAVHFGPTSANEPGGPRGAPQRPRWGLLVLVLALGVAVVIAALVQWRPWADDGIRSEPGSDLASTVEIHSAAPDSIGADEPDHASPEVETVDPEPAPAQLAEAPESAPRLEPEASEPEHPEATTRPPSRKRNRPTGSRPKKPATPSAEECEQTRSAARQAKRKIDWKAVLVHTQRVACWSGAERKRLRVVALLELGRYDDCVQESKGSTDPRVVRVGEACKGFSR